MQWRHEDVLTTYLSGWKRLAICLANLLRSSKGAARHSFHSACAWMCLRKSSFVSKGHLLGSSCSSTSGTSLQKNQKNVQLWDCKKQKKKVFEEANGMGALTPFS